MSAITIVTGFERKNGQRIAQTAEVKAGDFISEFLVTDSIVYEVVKVTKATITVRATSAGENVTEDTSVDQVPGLPVIWQERVSNPDASTRTLRVRKDGTVRSGSHVGASPFYPSTTVNGKPVSRTDFRF